MTDPELRAAHYVALAVRYAGKADADKWMIGYAAAKLDRYQPYGTKAIADEAGISPSGVENYRHAHEIFMDAERKFPLVMRNARRALTISHFRVGWEMKRKYNLTTDVIFGYLIGCLSLKQERQPYSAEVMRMQIEVDCDKSGKPVVWAGMAKSVESMMVKVLATADAPDPIRKAAQLMLNWFGK